MLLNAEEQIRTLQQKNREVFKVYGTSDKQPLSNEPKGSKL